VRKSTGKVRLCLDARELNKVTKKDAYPLPLIEGLLGRLDQTKFISAIDLKDAFWQIPLDPQSRDKTAFTVPGRPLYQFTVMPFGLCNAPQTMCRLMHQVIPSEFHSNIFVYIDDLLITSSTLQEHFCLLRKVSERLKLAGLTVNVEKCKFVVKEMSYLGYIVGNGCLQTNPEKIQGIIDYPPPKTLKQIRRFLGLCGWYRRFIKNFAIIASPITDLLKKSKKLVWNSQAQEAFEKLKLSLSTAPVLANPDFNRQFYIQCDACKDGIGGVLFQVDDDGAERPISFISQKLNAAQKNYSTTELECLAVIISIKRFRCYIEGYPFKIYTDHASLQWLMTQKDLAGRLARWSMKLQPYDFSVAYRKGSENIVADSLSRAYCEALNVSKDINWLKQGYSNVVFIDTPYVCSIDINDSLVSKTCEETPDKELVPLSIDLDSNAFRSDEYLDQIRAVENLLETSDCNYSVQDGKLLVQIKYGSRYTETDVSEWKLVVPLDLRNDLIKLAHNSTTSAHMGIDKTIEKLQRQFYWPKMIHEIREYIKNCVKCKMNKAGNSLLRPPMGKSRESSRPFQHLYVDFLGPYPRSKRGNCFLLIVLDHYSKFILLKPLRTATSGHLCEFIENQIFNRFSVPEIITTDNGNQFRAKQFQALLEKYGVHHNRTPIYSPQCNASERVNRTIIAAIRMYIADSHSNWDIYIQEIAAAIRNCIHSSTSFPPFFLVFGQYMTLHGSDYKLRRLLDKVDDNYLHINSKPDRLNAVKEKVILYLKTAYEKSAHTYNLRSRNRNLEIGQKVFVRCFVQSDAANKFASKLHHKFMPAIVEEKVGNVAYKIKDKSDKPLGLYHLKDIRV